MTVMTTCLHGGTSGGHGHQVLASEMTTMVRGRVKIPICFECRKAKLLREKSVVFMGLRAFAPPLNGE